MSGSNFFREEETSEDEQKYDIQERETYSLSIITAWLKEKNIPFNYAQASLGMLSSIYNHGIRINIKDNDVLSIQTHPDVAGWAFAETLVRSNMLSDIRHETPEKLFEFIETLL